MKQSLDTFCELLTLLEEKRKKMKDQRKDHGTVDKPSLVQQFCKWTVITIKPEYLNVENLKKLSRD